MVLAALRQRNPGASIGHILWWSCFCQPLMWLVLRVFWGYRTWNVHRVPRTGPVLLVCNHQSYLDLGVLGAGIWKRHFHSMARSTLFDSPVFGWFIRSLNAFSVDQGKGDVKALRTAIRLLQEGQLVLVFPEGSRTPDGFVDKFQEGLMLLIRRAKPTVVPMAVDGVFDVWPIGQSRPKRDGRVGSQFGQPIPAETLLKMPPSDAVAMLRRQVDDLRLEVRKKLRLASGGKYPSDHLADQPSPKTGEL